jgi:hypothetical protein
MSLADYRCGCTWVGKRSDCLDTLIQFKKSRSAAQAKGGNDHSGREEELEVPPQRRSLAPTGKNISFS